ncbi:MAG: hypothetical protein LBR37_02855 [Erysipelotrichaceae bacterium]|jgi:uncharacterized protein YneF (UPF0154 family)|nr:hypothetical protein [Erysipelotrichaceae bacterium]
MNKKKKLAVLLRVIIVLNISILIYIMLYYTIFHKTHLGITKLHHIILLVGAIIGLFVSMFFLDKITAKPRVTSNRTKEEILQSLAEEHLIKRNPTAEELHLCLVDIVKKHKLIRVRSGFLSYDLIYYIKPGKWFGFTFPDDYRDDYLEIKIGELYHFADLIPRLVIIGEYQEIIKQLNANGVMTSRIPLTKNASRNLDNTLEIIINTFELVILNIETYHDQNDLPRMAPFLLKELPTFKELKEVDKNAIMEDNSSHNMG